MQQVHNERGVALVISLFALIVMGALITAGFTPSYLEQHVAQNSRQAGQAFEAAEYGLSEISGAWNTGTWNGLAIGDSATQSGTLPSGRGDYTAQVRRLNTELFLIDLTGTDDAGRARQRIGQIFRLRILDVEAEAALTTRGPTTIGGSAQINGDDVHPSGWGCNTPLDTTKAGIRTQNPNDLSYNGAGCQNGACINGNPATEADTTMTDSTFFVYGDMTWTDLIGMATISLTPGTYKAQPNATGGVCVNMPTNWGDPTNISSPCFSYFPIIYQSGNMTVNGNIGQGILLVEGDLSVQGNFQFFGLVIVKGKLKTTGTGGHFNGAVMAANVDLDDQKVLGNALVQYSSCSLLRALQSASSARRLASRGWLYTI